MKKAIVPAILLVCGLFWTLCKNNATAPLPPAPTNYVALTKTQVAAFFSQPAATLQGKLVYVKTDGDKCPYFIDFSLPGDTLREQKLCSFSFIQSPLISPDGGYVTFAVDSNIYVCALAANAVPTKIAVGYDPHWWLDAGVYYLVYCSATGTSMSWPNPGKTWMQAVTLLPVPVVGTRVELAGYSLNGGLSKSGRYLATAYLSTGIYDRTELKWKSVISVTQACNASISPSLDPSLEPRIMYLTLGGTIIQGQPYEQHEVIVIDDTTTANLDSQVKKLIHLPAGVTEWQKPEWSTNENYSVATGKKDLWDVYLISLKTGAMAPQKIVIGDGKDSYDLYPHLWVPAAY